MSFSYLAKARVLAHSLKRFHPDWSFCACITDREPEGFSFNPKDEVFDNIIWGDSLGIGEGRGWLFKHDVIEACTAVKGPVLELLLRDGFEKVIYLDPDVAVFAPLTPLVQLLDSFDVLLTPHQLEPEETHTAILDNEVGSLSTGIFNLGFLAVRNSPEGGRFAAWWSERLQNLCYDDRPRGIFVDQKWCDFVPVFFNGVHIVKDPGYNVASWNLTHRRIAITEQGEILVNDVPLRFFHFTKLGPVGDAMTQRYAKDNVEVYELWSWYRRMVERFGVAEIPQGWWRYGKFENDEPIPKLAREVYRQRSDLRRAFPDPFKVEGGGFFKWLREEGRI